MKKNLILFTSSILLLSGCTSVVNTADSADFACPGMPSGVLCKTPGAVYKSTNESLPISDFDTPVGSPAISKTQIETANPLQKSASEVKKSSSYSLPIIQLPNRNAARPKPVREPAQIIRVWIAPWVDVSDNLHLAQLHYSEITPRTWTVGKPEIKGGAGYVIPHLAFESIAPTVDVPLAPVTPTK